MDFDAVLQELRQEHGRLTDAIEALEQRGRPSRIDGPVLMAGRPNFLPRIAAGVQWQDLHLSQRGHRRLTERYGKPAELSEMPVDKLLAIPHFGRKSLDQLLEALTKAEATEKPARGRESAKEDGGKRQRVVQELRGQSVSNKILASDLRFGPLIRLLDPQAEMAERIGNRQASSLGGDAIERLARLQRAIAEAQQLSLEEELAQFLEMISNSRHRAIWARLEGWDGAGGRVLEEVGREHGLTRERVRQICSGVHGSLCGPHFVPALEKALAVVQQRAGRPAAEVEEELCAVGLTRQRFALRGLRRAAETFQQDPQFALDKAGLVIGSEMPADLSERVLEAARREVRAAGAGQAADLCAGLAGVYGFQIGPATVWHVLERERDFTCLDKAAGWYCLMDVRNPVVSRVFKLLSVVPRVTESCFRELMGKGWRRNGGKIHGFAPPEVLWKLCGQLAWCRVNDGILEATGPLEPSTLSKAERVLVGILRNHGGVLQGAELSRYAGEAGVGNAMAQQALLRSPLFLKYGRGRYGLPGWGEPELETRRVPTGEIVWFGESEVEITAASGASADASLDGPPMPICPTRDAHLDTQVVVRTTASVEEHLKTALRDLTERQRGINEELSRIDSLRAESETIAKQIDAVNLTLQVFADDPRGRSPEGSKRRAQQKQNIQTFVVDSENRITAFDSAEAASASVGERFGNWSELVALAATWPAQRLVSVWNGLAGIKPVKRFQDRQEGVGRIWKRLQRVYPF